MDLVEVEILQAQLGLPLHVVVRPLDNPRLDALLETMPDDPAASPSSTDPSTTPSTTDRTHTGAGG